MNRRAFFELFAAAGLSSLLPFEHTERVPAIELAKRGVRPRREWRYSVNSDYYFVPRNQLAEALGGSQK